MRDFIVFMHDDASAEPPPEAWSAYLLRLRELDIFDGGSAIGSGATFRKQGPAGALSGQLSGYIRIRADSLAAAEEALAGNPVYECGGTVEIRELPRT